MFSFLFSDSWMNIKEVLFIAVSVSYMYIVVGWDNNHISAMSTGALKCFAIVPLTGQSVNVSDDLHPLNRTILKIQAGIDAGKVLLTHWGQKSTHRHSEKIGDIAKKIGPFLGAIGPMFGFLDFFIPKGPSPVMQLMRKQFEQINERFDQVVCWY